MFPILTTSVRCHHSVSLRRVRLRNAGAVVYPGSGKSLSYYTHCTLHTAQYKLHTINGTLHTVNYRMHTLHITLHTAHCTLPLAVTSLCHTRPNWAPRRGVGGYWGKRGGDITGSKMSGKLGLNCSKGNSFSTETENLILSMKFEVRVKERDKHWRYQLLL